ncbi:hypothetical protein MCOR27_011706 [Pyricularia oryzae]|uniref:Uncharacterized protein n=1 Tax=Pyricularia grisea TaxID=148305 RepID=A0ABQ8NFZ9_PYRGI|nr:hypothetical protein MCOR19_008652 [Pyricularia oryzae]KAI6296442.1 hypothetical protein MCOR33_006935 [Pyricularia grisea]KAI6264480.1 hypothetical protein MCOR27_011706 [Pyricularia oryzae]KAI6317290.1 hypothetical protein MCOR30_009097 [Pyricularia oryzae]KAI6351261.1 hypothetical protein MCOR32_011686 [Pyricularia oryzae]
MHFECTVCLAVARTGAVNDHLLSCCTRVNWVQDLSQHGVRLSKPSIGMAPCVDRSTSRPVVRIHGTSKLTSTVAATIDGLAPLIFGALEYEYSTYSSSSSTTIELDVTRLPRLLIDRDESQPARNSIFNSTAFLSFSYGEGFFGSSWLASSRTVPDEVRQVFRGP